jgi:flagellar motor switch protein FliG
MASDNQAGGDQPKNLHRRAASIDLKGRPGTVPLAFLDGLSPDHVARRLTREPPSAIAYVLDQLDPGHAGLVLEARGELRREEVLEVLRAAPPLKLSGAVFISLLARPRQADDADTA